MNVETIEPVRKIRVSKPIKDIIEANANKPFLAIKDHGVIVNSTVIENRSLSIKLRFIDSERGPINTVNLFNLDVDSTSTIDKEYLEKSFHSELTNLIYMSVVEIPSWVSKYIVRNENTIKVDDFRIDMDINYHIDFEPFFDLVKDALSVYVLLSFKVNPSLNPTKTPFGEIKDLLFGDIDNQLMNINGSFPAPVFKGHAWMWLLSITNVLEQLDDMNVAVIS